MFDVISKYVNRAGMEILQIGILSIFVIATGVFVSLTWFRKPKFFPQLQDYLNEVQHESVYLPAERREALDRLRDYALQRLYKGKTASVLFICAENCGRSILGQVWLEVMAKSYDLPQILSYSGGTQLAKLDTGIIQALEDSGVQVKPIEDPLGNRISIRSGPQNRGISVFSKYFDDTTNPKKNFVAVTTDEFSQQFLEKVTGAHLKIPLVYDDPKDVQNLEKLCFKVAAEMMYLTREIKRAIDPSYVHESAKLQQTVLKPEEITSKQTIVA